MLWCKKQHTEQPMHRYTFDVSISLLRNIKVIWHSREAAACKQQNLIPEYIQLHDELGVWKRSPLVNKHVFYILSLETGVILNVCLTWYFNNGNIYHNIKSQQFSNSVNNMNITVDENSGHISNKFIHFSNISHLNVEWCHNLSELS